MRPGRAVEDREMLVSIWSGHASAIRQDGFDLVARNSLARSGALMRLPLLPRHARQPCHADEGDLIAEKLLRKRRELAPTDRGSDGVEQGAQRSDLAHVRIDAELQRQGVAVREPVELDLRKLKLALAGRKRGREGQYQANRASPDTPPEIARGSPIRTRFGPERNSKSGHQKEPSGITGIGRTARVMHQLRETGQP